MKKILSVIWACLKTALSKVGDFFTDSNGNGDVIRFLGLVTVVFAAVGYLGEAQNVQLVLMFGFGAMAFGKISDIFVRPADKTPFSLWDFLTDSDGSGDIIRAVGVLLVLTGLFAWALKGFDPTTLLSTGFGAAAIGKAGDRIIPRKPDNGS